jgi:hypothetical protein
VGFAARGKQNKPLDENFVSGIALGARTLYHNRSDD